MLDGGSARPQAVEMHPLGRSIAALVLMLIIGAVAPASAHSMRELESQLMDRERYVEMTNRQAPGFTLDNADGGAVSLDDFAGKIVVLNFTYARCKDVCPLHSQLIATVQDQINVTPLRDQVQFISIATDAEDNAETMDIMRSYATVHGLDPANWLFLYRGSGAASATIDLAQRYGLKFIYTEDGDQMHGVITYVIDETGTIRARFHGLDFDPTNLTQYVNALVNDRHGSERPEAAADNAGVAAQGLHPPRAVPDRWLAVLIAAIGLGLVALAIPAYRTYRRRVG